MSTAGTVKNERILSGRPLPTVLVFALPIVFGNVFQQLYNIVDAIVVGNFLGDTALAGISVASPIMDVVNALIIGGTIGVGVLTAMLFGAKNHARLKTVHATSLLGGGLITVLLAVIGFAFSGAILSAQGTDSAVCAEALKYLHIVFAGLIFCFLYNYYAALLRSCGDSRTPFIVLLISSVLHALLDVLLTGYLGMGVVGVAVSTVFCQAFSAVLCIVFAHRRLGALRLGRGELRINWREGRNVLNYAWAAALQQAVVCVGRLLIQGMLTGLGTETVTGYNMGMRTEAFIFCFSQGISAAMVVCISQNYGHGSFSRMRRFHGSGLVIVIVLAAVVGVICRTIPHRLIGVFSSNPSVIAAGVKYTGTMAFFYIFSFLGEITQGFFRSMGRLRLTMIASILQVLLRVVLSYFMIPLYGITGICLSVAAGWILLVIIEGGYSIKVSRAIACREDASAAEG